MENQKWTIDATQSETAFQVRKLMIMNVHGSFEKFEGQLETEGDNFETLRNIQFKAIVSSIKTDDEKRNTHLKSADFFDVDTYPYLTFNAKSLNTGDKKIAGELSIRNCTKPVVFDVKFPETTSDDHGEPQIGLSILGEINRKDFGLSWDGTNEAGEIFVGDKIKLSAQIRFVKEAISKEKISEDSL